MNHLVIVWPDILLHMYPLFFVFVLPKWSQTEYTVLCLHFYSAVYSEHCSRSTDVYLLCQLKCSLNWKEQPFIFQKFIWKMWDIIYPLVRNVFSWVYEWSCWHTPPLPVNSVVLLSFVLRRLEMFPFESRHLSFCTQHFMHLHCP